MAITAAKGSGFRALLENTRAEKQQRLRNIDEGLIERRAQIASLEEERQQTVRLIAEIECILFDPRLSLE